MEKVLKKQTDNLNGNIIVERSFTTNEVICLFEKLEKNRSCFYAEDACDMVTLNDFFKEEGLIK